MIPLSVRGVGKSFGNQAVLEAVHLRVESEQCVALTGRSGSGKTTLLNIIAGLQGADRGTVEIEGKPLGTNPEQRAAVRRQKMGIVFQSHNLIPTLTVTENLLFPLALNRMEVRGRAQQWLQRLGLQHAADRLPETLSGGESQRVAVARALIHEPAILLADEPTASLDEDNASIVMAELLDHTRLQGAALLLITHSSELSARLDGRVCLERGRLVEQPQSVPG